VVAVVALSTLEAPPPASSAGARVTSLAGAATATALVAAVVTSQLAQVAASVAQALAAGLAPQVEAINPSTAEAGLVLVVHSDGTTTRIAPRSIETAVSGRNGSSMVGGSTLTLALSNREA
jgi:hypothetical protein